MIDDLAEWMDSTFTKYREMPAGDGLAPGDGIVSEAEGSDSAITLVSKRRESSGSESPAKKSCTSSGMGTPKGESRIAGHTITEMELVRRRRLQDSHLFD